MKRRSYISKRRWKARCLMGRKIPFEAIENHRLWRWFTFDFIDDHSFMTRHVRTRVVSLPKKRLRPLSVWE